MMSAPDKAENVPGYGFAPSYVPPPHPAQQNAMPVTHQWNMNPMHNGPNGYPGAMMWNVTSPPPQIIYQNGNQQWAIQTLPPPYVGTPAIPQDTRLATLHKTFLKGKPYGLGIVLIVTAILEIAFAIAVPFLVDSVTVYSGIPFWASMFYITAGSLSVSAHKNPSVCKVKGALTLNIISSIVSMIAIILSIVDFSIIDCDEDNDHYHDNDDYGYCSGDHGSAGITVIAFILVMNLLIFCVSVSLSVFGCRAVETKPANAPAAFVIQNNEAVSMPPSTVTPWSTGNFTNRPPPYALEEGNVYVLEEGMK